jgi:hypothetical protein
MQFRRSLRLEAMPMVMMARVAVVVVGAGVVIAVANVSSHVPTSRGQVTPSRFRAFSIFVTRAMDSFG